MEDEFDIIGISVPKIIRVVDYCEMCVTKDDGMKLYNAITNIINNNGRTIVSFDGVGDWMTAEFLSSSFGMLLKDRSREQLRELVRVADIDDCDRDILVKVIDNAEKFWNDSKTNVF